MITFSVSCGAGTREVEERLHGMGVRVGHKILDLIMIREKGMKRDNGIMSLLTFICQVCWRYLFGKTAELLKCNKKNEYILTDPTWSFGQYVNVPAHLGDLTVGAYAAGVVEGILCA